MSWHKQIIYPAFSSLVKRKISVGRALRFRKRFIFFFQRPFLIIAFLQTFCLSLLTHEMAQLVLDWSTRCRRWWRFSASLRGGTVRSRRKPPLAAWAFQDQCSRQTTSCPSSATFNRDSLKEWKCLFSGGRRPRDNYKGWVTEWGVRSSSHSDGLMRT